MFVYLNFRVLLHVILVGWIEIDNINVFIWQLSTVKNCPTPACYDTILYQFGMGDYEGCWVIPSLTQKTFADGRNHENRGRGGRLKGAIIIKL